MYFRYLIVILFVMYLVGCATMNSKFTCKTSDGVMCRSLDDVNSMIDRGEFTQRSQKENIKNALNFSPMMMHATYPNPIRDGETVMRIWVAPYEDNSGNYHADHVLYTVIKPNHWVGIPPREIVNLD